MEDVLTALPVLWLQKSGAAGLPTIRPAGGSLHTPTPFTTRLPPNKHAREFFRGTHTPSQMELSENVPHLPVD